MVIEPIVLVIGMFLLLFLGVLTGFPLALPVGGAGMIFGYLMLGDTVFDMIYARVYAQLTSTGFMAVPLFVFMGGMLERSGIAKKMFESLYLLFGRLRGGLAIVAVVIGTIMAACIGVVAASVSMLTLVALPVMIKRGYDKGLATGSICAAGTLGILIPPSIMLIVYGPAAWISVGKLFSAAFGPGIMLSLLYIIYIIVRSFLQPSIAPSASQAEQDSYTLPQKLVLVVKSLMPTLILILAVLGAIYTGIAAPTEAAAIGAVASVLLTVAYGKFSWKSVMEVSLNTLKLTGMVLLIAACSTAFVSVFMAGGGGGVIEKFILGFPGGKWAVFWMIMLITFIMGAFIDWVGIIFVLIPILSPIIPKLGFDPLWFAMMVIVNLQMSFMTPPFAYAMFFLKGSADPALGIETKDIIRGSMPFVGIIAIGLVLLILFPQIVLWLPSKM